MFIKFNSKVKFSLITGNMRIVEKLFILLILYFIFIDKVFALEFSIGIIAYNYNLHACDKPESDKLNVEGLNIELTKKSINEYTIKEYTRDDYPRCIIITTDQSDFGNFKPTFRLETDLIESSMLKLSIDYMLPTTFTAEGSIGSSAINPGYNYIKIDYNSSDLLLRIYSGGFKKDKFSIEPFIGSSLGERTLKIKLNEEVYTDFKNKDFNPQRNYNFGIRANFQESFFVSYTHQVHWTKVTRISHYYFLIAYDF